MKHSPRKKPEYHWLAKRITSLGLKARRITVVGDVVDIRIGGVDIRIVILFLFPRLASQVLGNPLAIKEFKYRERSDGYVSKCHLCVDIRKHIVGITDEIKELGPKTFL